MEEEDPSPKRLFINVKMNLDESGVNIRLEVDGGCGVANIKDIAEAGADMFVAGSAVLKV